ncbi:DUF4123 domain-containing protein [Stenotrophomonas sp. MMGLT7]|uniref:DUF4123 domain-containing protein n=1 Tax=Stenotrophomonas sp. MMGLT7 TaxID=2901227 RepID=UPI001E5DD47C|nr:DUF4123 domain-containing protein [Stenotrophomonas sp. MMGLT7]MCD7099532.1 DUF4123 domain-containing protein [Stenotrophomonas sp. MMGLT7]
MDHREFLEFEYALVNPTQLEPEQWRDLPAESLRPRSFSAKPETLPQVVALNALSLDKRADLLMRSEQWLRGNRAPLFSALLRSGQRQETLVAHFSARQIVATPQGQRFLLRFHDPRVFARLDWLLNGAQIRQLLGPVDAWTWFDGLAGQWRTLHKPAPAKKPMPTMLSGEQWAALHRLPALNLCLKRLWREGRVPQDYRALAERVDASVREALSLGMADRDDACRYALGVERYGPQWPDRPYVRDAIRLAQSGEQSLVRGLADSEESGPHSAAHEVDHSSRYV